MRSSSTLHNIAIYSVTKDTWTRNIFHTHPNLNCRAPWIRSKSHPLTHLFSIEHISKECFIWEVILHPNIIQLVAWKIIYPSLVVTGSWIRPLNLTIHFQHQCVILGIESLEVVVNYDGVLFSWSSLEQKLKRTWPKCWTKNSINTTGKGCNTLFRARRGGKTEAVAKQ